MIVKESLYYETADARIEKRKKTIRTTLAGFASYGWIILIAISTLLPYLWMLSNSLKPRAEIAFYQLLPVHPTLDNYIKILLKYPFGQWYLNTFIVTFISVVSTLLFCSLAGYALAKFRFPGRNLFFIFILSHSHGSRRNVNSTLVRRRLPAESYQQLCGTGATRAD